MGIIGNFNVYGLMILPLAMLVRGKNISLSRLVPLMVITVMLQFAGSIMRASVTGMAVPSLVVEALLIPVVETCYFTHVLTDSKAVKVFRVQSAVEGEDVNAENSEKDGPGDMAAAVAVVWCMCYTVFFRFGDWYRSMGSLGFEPASLHSGAEAFAQLLATLATCRMILASGANVAVLAVPVLSRAVATVMGPVAGDQLSAVVGVSLGLYVTGPTIVSVLSAAVKSK